MKYITKNNIAGCLVGVPLGIVFGIGITESNIYLVVSPIVCFIGVGLREYLQYKITVLKTKNKVIDDFRKAF